jgi:hypothetical protein
MIHATNLVRIAIDAGNVDAWMRSIGMVRVSDCQCQSTTFLSSIPASSDTMEPEGRQMKKCSLHYKGKKIQKIPLLTLMCHRIIVFTPSLIVKVIAY